MAKKRLTSISKGIIIGNMYRNNFYTNMANRRKTWQHWLKLEQN